MTEEISAEHNTPSDSGGLDKAEDILNFPGGERRLSADWGTVMLEISADFLEVFLLLLEFTPPQRAVSAEMLSQLLRENKIVNGIVMEKLEAVAAEAAGSSGWSGRMIIAEGRPAGVPGGIRYTFLGEEAAEWHTDGNVWQGREATLSFQGLSEFQAAPGQPGGDILVKAVGPGEIIAEREEPLKGRPGRDIYGRSIAAPRFTGLMAGDYVEITNLREFRATIFGYVLILNKQLSVVSPLRLADDEMTAWFINFPQLAPQRTPEPDDIVKALKNLGVTTGVKKKAIDRLCQAESLAKQECWFVVARGREPVRGENGRIKFPVNREKPAGDLKENGSMDFRARNLVKTVAKDALIAVKHPATPGRPGSTLLGGELPADPGAELRVDAKENVRVEEEEGGIVNYYAECEGQILYKGNKLSINPLYRVTGNVDFSTGNIDVDCSLNIAGSVCSDFTVQATGNVVIGGGVEPSAQLTVQGDLLVKGGILGEHTKVTVLGNLEADYIQAAMVVVKGNLDVKQYIYHAIVRTVGEIRVGPGRGERGGSISGGTVCSSRRITISSCGSASNVPTVLALAPAPDKLDRLKKLKNNIMICDETISRIMRTLDISHLDREEIIALLEPLPLERKKLFSQLLAKLKNTTEHKARIGQTISRLKNEMRADLGTMKITISRRFYGNTTIRIGKKEFLEKTDHGPVVFSYRDNGIHVEFSGRKDGDKTDELLNLNL